MAFEAKVNPYDKAGGKYWSLKEIAMEFGGKGMICNGELAKGSGIDYSIDLTQLPAAMQAQVEPTQLSPISASQMSDVKTTSPAVPPGPISLPASVPLHVPAAVATSPMTPAVPSASAPSAPSAASVPSPITGSLVGNTSMTQTTQYGGGLMENLKQVVINSDARIFLVTAKKLQAGGRRTRRSGTRRSGTRRHSRRTHRGKRY